MNEPVIPADADTAPATVILPVVVKAPVISTPAASTLATSVLSMSNKITSSVPKSIVLFCELPPTTSALFLTDVIPV